MASVLFGNTIDMLTVATPSSGYIVAYDLDGILKQKDEFGVITEIGGGPTAGIGMTPSLNEVLNTGNTTYGNDIILSNDDVIIAATGGALLNLRNGGDGSVLLGLPSTTYGGKGGSGDGGAVLFLDPNSVVLGLNGGDYSEPYLYLTTQYSQLADYSTHSNSYYGFNLYRNSNFNSYSNGISIKENVTFNFTSVNQNNYSIIIGSRNSTTNAGVFNSPVIGGQSLNATQSNTVYLGNTVNINNAYNLPNVDGSNNQVLKTNGSGNTYWDNSTIPGLEEVLDINNSSGIYSIVMGMGTSITSPPGGQIDLSFGATNSVIISTDYGNLNKAYIRLDDDSIIVESNDFSIGVNNALVTTFDSRGLVYAFDYSSNFVTHSLIDRNYVDNIVASASNFANTNLTFTGNREHDLNSNYIYIADSNNTEFPYFGLTPLTAVYMGYYNQDTTFNEIRVGTQQIEFISKSLQIMTIDNSQILIQGTLSINGTVSTNGFILPTGAQDGYILTSDASGNATWNIGVNKYAATASFTAGITQSITHSLNTEDIIVQTYNSSGNQIIPGNIQINGTASVDIVFSSTLSNVKIVVIG